MKEIILTNGMVSLVDDEDYAYLSQFAWRAIAGRTRVYARRTHTFPDGTRRNVAMHNFIMGPAPAGMTVDHINHEATLDNRRCNLRFATHAQQMWNIAVRVKSGTGIKGVYAYRRNPSDTSIPITYGARIRVNNVKLFLGYYKTPAEAEAAYIEAAKQLRDGVKPTSNTYVSEGDEQPAPFQRRQPKPNKTGYSGVTFVTDPRYNNSHYIATMIRNGKRVFLGTFKTAEAASEAYQSAKQKKETED